MFKIAFFFLLAFSPFLIFSQPYKKLHFKSIVVDTHNDLLSKAVDDGVVIDTDLSGKTHSDIDRFKKGGIDLQLFSVWCDGQKENPYAWANREMDTLDAVANRNPDKLIMIEKFSQLNQTFKEKKLAAMFGVEGGHMIENNLDNLNRFYARGVRYMTLTWNNSTDWASSAWDETNRPEKLKQKGLTDFGRQVVKRMNELGMLVDLSHVGEKTFFDAIAATSKPVLVSHSCVYELCRVPRNLKDEQIKAIGKNGGVFSANHKKERDSLLNINPESYFADFYLFEKYPDEVISLRPPLSMLIDHLDYIVKLIGIDHVGLGSDFDGINSAPQQLDDVTNMPLITKELLKRGYSKKDVKKILGLNFLRILEANSPNK